MDKFKSQYEDEYNNLIDALNDEISESPRKNEPRFNNEKSLTGGFTTDFDNNDYDYIHEMIR